MAEALASFFGGGAFSFSKKKEGNYFSASTKTFARRATMRAWTRRRPTSAAVPKGAEGPQAPQRWQGTVVRSFLDQT